jgi:hypothetical protein
MAYILSIIRPSLKSHEVKDESFVYAVDTRVKWFIRKMKKKQKMIFLTFIQSQNG